MTTRFGGILVCDIFSHVAVELAPASSFVYPSFRPVLTSFLAFENLRFPWIVSNFMSAMFNVLLMISSTPRAYDPLLCVNLNCFMFDGRIAFVFLSVHAILADFRQKFWNYHSILWANGGGQVVQGEPALDFL